MYQYKYVTVELRTKWNGYTLEESHRAIINKYAADGWRFVTAVPNRLVGYGAIKELDLVFEKEAEK